MKRGVLWISLFALINAFVCAEEIPTKNIGLYDLEFNRKVKVDGTKVYIVNEKKYVELQNLLDILGITNNKWINDEFIIDSGNIYTQETTINLNKKIIKKNNKKINYQNEIFEKDDKIYIDISFLKNILSLSEVDVDEDRLNIAIQTLFQLPAELENLREYRKEKFLEGDTSLKKDVPEQRKLFEPGNLRLTYNYNKSFQRYNSESKSLDTEYYGPLLYGELEVYHGIYPDLKNYQTRLTYRDVYKDHDIIFGDNYIKMPEILSGTVSKVRGISFTRDNKISSIDETADNITITGQAPLGKFVELYRNGQLLSYEDVKAGRYIFENVPTLFNSDSFYVIIYNQDGSIVKEDLRRDYNKDLEKKGEFGYNIFMGDSDYDKYYQFIGEVNYGLTDTLTLKTGYYDLKYTSYWNETPQNRESLKLGAVYVGDFSKYPFSIDVETFKNSGGNGEDYYYKYKQDFNDYRLTAEGGKYSKITENRIFKKDEQAFEISKSKFLNENLSLALKYYTTNYSYTGRENEIGAVLRAGFRNFTPEYGIYRNLTTDYTQHDFSIRSYYFKDYILYAGVSHKTLRNYDETKYKFEVTSKRYTDNGIRYRAYYEKSDRYGDVFGLAFDIDYNDWFTGTASYKKDRGTSYSDTGFTVDKLINLRDVNAPINSIDNGRIAGVVYVDNNNNNRYDEGIDKPLPRTEVNVRGNIATTDENGKYKLSNLYPGVYTTKFETQNPLYKAEADKYKVKIGPATTTNLDIPMKSRKIVSGNINIEDATLKYTLLPTLLLNVYDMSSNEKIEVVVPEKDGFFMIENLTGGKYKVILESINSPGKALYEKELDISQTDDEEKLVELNILGDNEKNLKYELELY